MDIIIWVGVMVATAVVVWIAAPYHDRIIGNRDLSVIDKNSG